MGARLYNTTYHQGIGGVIVSCRRPYRGRCLTRASEVREKMGEDGVAGGRVRSWGRWGRCVEGQRVSDRSHGSVAPVSALYV